MKGAAYRSALPGGTTTGEGAASPGNRAGDEPPEGRAMVTLDAQAGVDCHVHAVGNGKDLSAVDDDVFYEASDNPHWLVRLLQGLVEQQLLGEGADLDHRDSVSTDEYFALLTRLLATSEEVDAIVVLAMDAVYDPGTGRVDSVRTDLVASNRFLSRKLADLNRQLEAAGTTKRFLLGASVSPNRADWADELDFVIDQTDAVLLKLIPSAQHVDVGHPRHARFWQRLAGAGLPLLCHVGPEYAFAEGRRNWRLDGFRHLEAVLDCGVTVIAAHCATPVFPVFDLDEFPDFVAFMHRENSGREVRLYADTSALALSTRIPYLRQVAERIPPEWLLNGSDFPIPVDGWAHLPLVAPQVSLEKYLGIVRTRNPLDRDVRIKRAAGLAASILTNARSVLRFGPPEPTETTGAPPGEPCPLRGGCGPRDTSRRMEGGGA